ncbi:beta-lactamase family protein [Pseudoalteromonas sp. 5Ae-yellow]|uniref:serine hydrolase domain-containing protein n=1 Tax=Pseudoalteromonas sp. 5Ae-yellow TaxID=2759847 RepID=UPI0015F78448|nr:serine hydrolase domain-containing protein [Pseudoalteromonas sp. 5Ae-yellow]MBA6409844.1 beta-lactamase family protein [Pseudoalteromonas sp. 5Ae-yellow]
MKYLNSLLYSLPALCLLFSSVGFAAKADPDWDAFVKKYGRYAQKKLKSKGIPGAALSIVSINNSDYIHTMGVTKTRNGQKVNKHTRFRLASVSKTFAGSLSAKLAANGLLELDKPVSDYIPDFKGTVYENDLKVFHLLSHSSGLVPNAYDNLIESRMDYPGIVEKLLSVKPICKPGECYGYQNVMFSLIGDVILQSTDTSYKQWLKEAIFEPLKMNDASLGFESMTNDKNYALPHVRGKKRWYSAKLKKNYYKVSPAAGVNASASDMAIWLKAQLGQYPDVLSLDTLAKQTRPYTNTKKEMYRRVWKKHLNEAYYGLGWRVYNYADETLYYHSGWVQGYRSDLVVFPHLNVGFSLIVNAETGVINELTTEFIDRLLEYKRGKKI